MSVSAVNLVRVSENLKSFRLLDSLRQNTLKLFSQQNQMSSGYQFTTPSENPMGAEMAMRMQQVLDRQDQILANLKAADGFLSASEQAAQDVGTLLIQAQGLASQNVSNLTDQTERNAAAAEVRSIIEQMVAIGNRTYQGRYLFGGRQTTSAPFVYDGNNVKYVGDTGSLQTQVDDLQDEAYNVAAGQLFGGVSQGVQGWKDWGVGLTTDTRLSDCGGLTGSGIAPGSVQISETGVASFTVDLTRAYTVGDVIDAISSAAAAAGSTVTASLNAAGNGLQLSSGGPTIAVTEASGVTARDLGILTPAPAALVDGSDIQPRLTAQTRLQDLGTVNLANLAAGFTIGNGSRSVLVNTGGLTGTSTLQDLLNLINQSAANVSARINEAGTGIDILNRVSGSPMTIGENGGTTAAELGIRSMYGGTPLSDLNGGNGVAGGTGADFRIVASVGGVVTNLDIDVDGCKTVADVISAIKTAPGNDPPVVVADLATQGNGIRLTLTGAGAKTLSVERLNLSPALDDLGLTGLQASGAGATVEIVGKDVNGIVPDGVFTALQRLYEALIAGDSGAITAAGGDVQRAITSVNSCQGDVGARSQAMQSRLTQTQSAIDATQKVLSDVRDLDYTRAITLFQQAQTALQANLMTGSRTLNLSLLDFLT